MKSGESKSKNWGIVKFPHPDGVAAGTTAAQISGTAVNANSDHKDAALDFIKFVTGPEGAAVIASTGTFLRSRRMTSAPRSRQHPAFLRMPPARRR